MFSMISLLLCYVVHILRAYYQTRESFNYLLNGESCQKAVQEIKLKIFIGKNLAKSIEELCREESITGVNITIVNPRAFWTRDATVYATVFVKNKPKIEIKVQRKPLSDTLHVLGYSTIPEPPVWKTFDKSKTLE